MKSDRKPPLVKSPLRLRPRRVIRSNATPMRTPLPASSTKIRMPNQGSRIKETGGIRPEYRTISCEIKALEMMVQEELGKARSKGGLGGFGSARSGSGFERGRFYDEYSARRDERLKRKMGGAIFDEDEEPKKAGFNVGVAVESSAKKEEMMMTTKKRVVPKKSVMESSLVDRSEHPRYSLRSMKKPPLPVPMSSVESSAVGKTTTRGSRARRN